MSDPRPTWARPVPSDPVAAAFLAAALSGAAGLLTVWLGTTVLRDYGIALFCGTPLAVSIAAPLFYGLGDRRGFLEFLGVSLLSMLVLFVGMCAFALEGLVCILLAAPLWMTVALVGTVIAHALHRRMWPPGPLSGARGFPVVMLALLVGMPLWMGAEHVHGVAADERVVTTAIEIDAPPAVVWDRVVSFPDLPTPGWRDGGWLFHAGIARPIRAELTAPGPGGHRACVFSTGRAEEPIRAWQPGRLLEVEVVTTPPSMEETSIYPNVRPAHLEGYLVSKRARFELTALPGGRTRLVGTSWYVNKMAPELYWGWWSDRAIKAVQTHVLAHVKALAEADGRP